MVIANVIKDCPVCKCRDVLHRIHEVPFGMKRREDCVICVMFKTVEEEWLKLTFRKKPHNTFAINTKRL